jgi:hypothetical protein
VSRLDHTTNHLCLEPSDLPLKLDQHPPDLGDAVSQGGRCRSPLPPRRVPLPQVVDGGGRPRAGPAVPRLPDAPALKRIVEVTRRLPNLSRDGLARHVAGRLAHEVPHLRRDAVGCALTSRGALPIRRGALPPPTLRCCRHHQRESDMADDDTPAGDEITDGSDWIYRLMNLERIQADDPDDDGEDIFTAKFQLDGPDANAEVEIIVSDYVDEAEVVPIALDTLHRATKAWARATENRRIAAREGLSQTPE